MLNKRYYALGTEPSFIRELFMYGLEQAKKVGAENVFDYSLGNPSIPAPKKINETICDVVSNVESVKLHGYSVAAGFEDARAAVAADLNRRFGTDYTAANLFFTCGAAPAIFATFCALTADEESEIITIAPFFPEYKVFVESAGAKFKIVPADTEAFQINLSSLDETISEHTQAVIINSPNNPSGVVYTEETLSALADLLRRKGEEYGHPIYIIADEPYRELVYGDVKVPFIPNIYENTIVCYSYSKSLSLPGERIGYVCVPDSCADSRDLYATVAGAARASGHVCPPTLIQKVIEICASEMPDLEAYERNRNRLFSSLREMGYEAAKPDGAFYLFVKAPNGDAMQFSLDAKEKENLLVVPGEVFGCPGYFRLSYCVSEEMIERSLPSFKRMIESYR
ncbi:MAG: pyridoxal phosphate-dependent aminotransferase [Mogibacterium sp.]|nr:pyridoxal phosphate-dependent aminotransferase [Mogibacterium sp.]